jgi:hypothetical protein
LYGLAQIAFDQGDFVETQRQGQESLAVFERIGHEDAAKVKEWLEGLPVMDSPFLKEAECSEDHP